MITTFTSPFDLGEAVMLDGEMPVMITKLEFARDHDAPIFEVSWWSGLDPTSMWAPAWRLTKVVWP